MKFEWKLPSIEADPMIYGKYLTLHSDMIPEQDVSLETEGYLIRSVDYGSAKGTHLPFKVGDWIDKKYVEGNFKAL